MKKYTSGACALALAMLFSLALWANIIPETEPNETPATAMNIAVGDTLSGIVADSFDVDYFAVSFPEGAFYIDFVYPTGSVVADWWRIIDVNGDEVVMECYYLPGGLTRSYFKVCTADTYFVEIKLNGVYGLSKTQYNFSVHPDTDDESECNDTPAMARVIDQPSVLTGKIALPGDLDFFRIVNAMPGAFSAAVNTPLDPGLAFEISLWLDPNAAPIATAAPGQNSIQTNLSVAGDYYLMVKYSNLDTATLNPYLLAVAYTMGSSACNITVDTTAVVVEPTVCGQSSGSISVPAPSDGVAPYQYALNGGQAQANGIFTGLAEGTYTVLVADSNSCTAEFSAVVNCIVCNPPQIGVNNVFKSGKSVQLVLVQQDVDSISINYGDGTTPSNSLFHTYATNGDFSITIAVFNACGTATASTTVSIRTVTLRIGWVDNVVIGDTIKIPIIVEEGNFQWAGVSGGVVIADTTVGNFLEIEPGTLHPSQIFYGNNNDRFAGVANAQANEAFEVGDTILYVSVKATGQQGDSTIVNIPDFNFAIFVNNLLEEPFVTITSGGFSMVRDIELRVQIQTPNFLPVPGVEVAITSVDTTIIVTTDASGFITIKVLYAAEYTLHCTKSSVVTAGINTIDAFIILRMLVLLPNSGLTPYSYLAADVDSSGTISINDPSLILNILVGNLLPPAQQYGFVPDYHVFGNYPSPGYMNFPMEYLVTNPDAVLGKDINIISFIRGDVNASAIPQLTASPDDRYGSETAWKYATTKENNENIRVGLYPEAGQSLVAGNLNLRYDHEAYELVSASFVQANNENMLVFNKNMAKSMGVLKMAFTSTNGKPSAFDQDLPLIELVFRPKALASGNYFDLDLDETTASQVFDVFSEVSNVTLERANQPEMPANIVVKAFPNPASTNLFVSLPSREAAQVELLDFTGKIMVQVATLPGAVQAVLPVNDVAAGIYIVRIKAADGTVFTTKVSVVR